jgi:hypothetical protein
MHNLKQLLIWLKNATRTSKTPRTEELVLVSLFFEGGDMLLSEPKSNQSDNGFKKIPVDTNTARLKPATTTPTPKKG